MAAVLQTPDFMTVAAFLAWDAPPGSAWQLIDGVPQAIAPASGTHALIQGEVGALLRNHLAANRPGCRLAMNPSVIPQADSGHNFRIPDAGVTCTPILRGAIAMGQPVLQTEILSPGNSMETWANVWGYTGIASVHEILVIRTASIGVQLLRRMPDGSWPDVPLAIRRAT